MTDQDGRKRFKYTVWLYLACGILFVITAVIGIIKYQNHRSKKAAIQKLLPLFDKARMSPTVESMDALAEELEEASSKHPLIAEEMEPSVRGWLNSEASNWFLDRSRAHLAKYREGILEKKLDAMQNARRAALCGSTDKRRVAIGLFRDIQLPKIVKNYGTVVVLLTENHTLVVGCITAGSDNSVDASEKLSLVDRIEFEGIQDAGNTRFRPDLAVLDENGVVYHIDIDLLYENAERKRYPQGSWQNLAFAKRLDLPVRFVCLSPGRYASKGISEEGCYWNLASLKMVPIPYGAVISICSICRKEIAILVTGKVVAWGLELRWKPSIGFGRNNYSRSPRIIPNLSNIVLIDCSEVLSLYVNAKGEVFHCGWNRDWNKKEPHIEFAEKVPETGKCIAVECRFTSCFAIDQDGNAVIWGRGKGILDHEPSEGEVLKTSVNGKVLRDFFDADQILTYDNNILDLWEYCENPKLLEVSIE